jgi:HK97 family phage prohead protease
MAERSEMNDLPNESPPRDLLIRVSEPFTLTRSEGDGMPKLHGLGATYDSWTEINSRFEGHFMERFAPGAFTKAISESRDQIRCLFHHGQDPAIGVKPLGTITALTEHQRGVEYDVDLFDADYVRSLLPGLEAGVYGSSFRFGITKKVDEQRRVRNEKGLLERTIKEATMRELGPTPFPAYVGTSAGLRSISDEFVLSRFPAEDLVSEAALRSTDQDLVGEIRSLAEKFIASDETDTDKMRGIITLLDQFTNTDALSSEAAPTGTSQPKAATPSNGLYGLHRDEEEAWRL